MNNKVYGGGLPFSVTDGQLQEIFQAHGTVESAQVISDKFTGQSRGLASLRWVPEARHKKPSVL